MDAVGFEAMYRAYHLSLFRYVNSQVKSCQLAEDIAGDTWVKAWIAIERGVEPHAPLAWLITIAKRLLIDHWRSLSYAYEPVSLDDLLDGTMNGDEAYWLTDPADMIEAAIGRVDALAIHLPLVELPVRQQQAIWLQFVEELTQREVAGVMGCNLGAVKQLRNRGIDNLKKRIAA